MTPQHVLIDNWPPPDSIAWLTLDFAIAAVVIAICTLIAVGIQIWLGRQELDAVREDLDYNKKQVAELMRRPKLSLTMKVLEMREVLTPLDGPDGRPARFVKMQFTVSNSGKAVARDVYVEIFIQADHLAADFNSWAEAFYDLVPPTRPIRHYLHPDSTTYTRYGFEIPKVLYPGNHDRDFEALFYFWPHTIQSKILWRIFDQYSSYPKNTNDEVPTGSLPTLLLIQANI